MQLELAGALPLDDGRYLARAGGRESILVIATRSAPAASGRRRRRPRQAAAQSTSSLPLTQAMAVRAHRPFAEEVQAAAWLEASIAADAVEAVVAEGAALLNRALHAQAVAGADPYLRQVDPQQAISVRIGYGRGQEVAEGRFAVAYEVDIRNSPGSLRRQRIEQLRPQERMAALLGGRESYDACETLLLRARADIDAGRWREAALQLRGALDALLRELAGTIGEHGHEEDMAQLTARRPEAQAAADTAANGELDDAQRAAVSELVALAERVLRRRRVLRR